MITSTKTLVAKYLVYVYLIAAVLGGAFIGHTILANRALARDARVTANEAKAATETAKVAAAKAERAAMDAHDAALDSNRALCLQRKSAQNRLSTAVQFRNDHPRGTEDFSLTLINRSIRTAQLDLKSLKGVECR